MTETIAVPSTCPPGIDEATPRAVVHGTLRPGSRGAATVESDITAILATMSLERVRSMGRDHLRDLLALDPAVGDEARSYDCTFDASAWIKAWREDLVARHPFLDEHLGEVSRGFRGTPDQLVRLLWQLARTGAPKQDVDDATTLLGLVLSRPSLTSPASELVDRVWSMLRPDVDHGDPDAVDHAARRRILLLDLAESWTGTLEDLDETAEYMSL